VLKGLYVVDPKNPRVVRDYIVLLDRLVVVTLGELRRRPLGDDVRSDGPRLVDQDIRVQELEVDQVCDDRGADMQVGPEPPRCGRNADAK
jgi:hypothetical protein